jgi:hypothetical protein
MQCRPIADTYHACVPLAQTQASNGKTETS